MSFAELRRELRRELHDTMCVPATITSPGSGVVNDVKVRRHNRVALIGGGEYMQSLEGVETLIFDIDELNQNGIFPHRGDVVTLTDDGAILILDTQVPQNGPINVMWRAVQP